MAKTVKKETVDIGQALRALLAEMQAHISGGGSVDSRSKMAEKLSKIISDL
jgi:hypothetical protein